MQSFALDKKTCFDEGSETCIWGICIWNISIDSPGKRKTNLEGFMDSGERLEDCVIQLLVKDISFWARLC
jgi:hypothetical protein